MNAPVKQQSQASKQQCVKNVVDDLWLLSNSPIFKFEVGFHWLTTAEKKTFFQHHNVSLTVTHASCLDLWFSKGKKQECVRRESLT